VTLTPHRLKLNRLARLSVKDPSSCRGDKISIRCSLTTVQLANSSNFAPVRFPGRKTIPTGAMDTVRVPDIEMNGAALADLQSQQPQQTPHRNIQLTIFREIVGINPTPALDFASTQRPAENKGLYRRTCQAESKVRLQYYACAATFNICFLLQIVVAAALTALGAANGPHLAVTVLGAVNTVIAGILTYLKGQGLPNRLRQYQRELRKVREYTEERERDFSRLDCTLNLDDEIAIIYRMYEAVRQNQEDNSPENYHSLTNSDGTKPVEAPGPQTPSMKQVEAIPDKKAISNGPQVNVTATEVPSGLSDRSSNRNSAHIPVSANGSPSGKVQETSGGFLSTETPAGQDVRPSSLEIEPATYGKSATPYTGLRRMSGGIPSERRRSSIERSPNRPSRQVSTDRPPPSKERATSRTGGRTSTDTGAGSRERSSHRISAYAPVERLAAPTGRSSNRNSGYESVPAERPTASIPSGRSSNRNSTYIPAERPQAPGENMPGLDTEIPYSERPAAPIPSGRSSRRNSAYTYVERPLVPHEGMPMVTNRDVSGEHDESQSEGSPSGNAGLAALSRRNSTTPVKHFFAAAQRRP